MSLAQAHEAARSKRHLISDGIDPVRQKRDAANARRAAQLKRMTFAEAANLCRKSDFQAL